MITPPLEQNHFLPPPIQTQSQHRATNPLQTSPPSFDPPRSEVEAPERYEEQLLRQRLPSSS